LTAACVLVAVLPAGAAASATQESILQDDNQLLYSSPSHVAEVLGEMASLGVERVRVSVIWALVAPDPDSRTPPQFDAANPAAYPPGAWTRYDDIVEDAQALGIGVDFNITSPDPDWAATAPSPSIKFKDYSPSPAEFGQFVQAVGTRYSGSYLTPTSSPVDPQPPPTLAGVPLPPPLFGTSTTTGPIPPEPLPRVDYWEIWNEPNQGGWLAPQWRRAPSDDAAAKSSQGWVEESPVIYRRLLAAAWNALSDTGHGGDTILIGDTSAKGGTRHGILPALAPITFLQALYCVGPSFRPLTGADAAGLACPTDGDPGVLAVDDPALFYATGYADHPYSFTQPPNVTSANQTWATLADLPRLERDLDRIFAVYGKPTPGGVPLYLTEWGYKSDPPNPYVHISEAQQAEYINEGEYMAWRDPYVRALAQFELVDGGPNTREPVGSAAYWGTFQTGLIGMNGLVKPSYYAYRIPIWLPHPQTGPQVTVWGQLRPADHSVPQFATIEYEPAGASSFEAIREVETTSSQGFILAHVPLAGPGSLRLGWLDPVTGQADHSRIVHVEAANSAVESPRMLTAPSGRGRG